MSNPAQPIEPSSLQFKQELNRWFEQNGILDNLRSHLRSLMIAVLQQTEIALRPAQRSSPKTQSTNLLVAEYLLKNGCHYTLSVLMSEVTSLASFAPGVIALHKKMKDAKHHFQEDEVMEILNCLGFSSCEEHARSICDSYMDRKEEESLLECLLGFTRNLQLRLSTVSYSDNRKRLSKEWLAQVNDLLVQSRSKPLQLSAAQEMLSRITESEIKRTAEEESNRQIELLVERERRIQEYLKSHEAEILKRLHHAEEELNNRRKTIDKELNERQLRLGRMAFQWQDKHNEIMAMSKNLASLQTENQNLKATVEKMKTEINQLRIEVTSKTEIIERLEADKHLLKSHIDDYLRCTRGRNDVEESESSSLVDDPLLAKAKTRLHLLEEESARILKSYSRYRQRYENVAESESDVPGTESPAGATSCAEESPERVQEVTPVKTRQNAATEIVLSQETKEAIAVQKPLETDVKTLVPTKRQQKNREFYLESKHVLEKKLERGAVVADLSNSTSDISADASEAIQIENDQKSFLEDAKAETPDSPNSKPL